MTTVPHTCELCGTEFVCEKWGKGSCSKCCAEYEWSEAYSLIVSDRVRACVNACATFSDEQLAAITCGQLAFELVPGHRFVMPMMLDAAISEACDATFDDPNQQFRITHLPEPPE